MMFRDILNKIGRMAAWQPPISGLAAAKPDIGGCQAAILPILFKMSRNIIIYYVLKPHKNPKTCAKPEFGTAF